MDGLWCLVVYGRSVFACQQKWVFEDVSESPKETLYIANHFSAEFSGYLIDFRGFRKLYFLGFSTNLNGCFLFVNPFYLFGVLGGPAGRASWRDAWLAGASLITITLFLWIREPHFFWPLFSFFIRFYVYPSELPQPRPGDGYRRPVRRGTMASRKAGLCCILTALWANRLQHSLLMQFMISIWYHIMISKRHEQKPWTFGKKWKQPQNPKVHPKAASLKSVQKKKGYRGKM